MYQLAWSWEGIAGTNVSYVAQKVKESLSRDGQFRELGERAGKTGEIHFLRVDPNS